MSNTYTSRTGRVSHYSDRYKVPVVRGEVYSFLIDNGEGSEALPRYERIWYGRYARERFATGDVLNITVQEYPGGKTYLRGSNTAPARKPAPRLDHPYED